MPEQQEDIPESQDSDRASLPGADQDATWLEHLAPTPEGSAKDTLQLQAPVNVTTGTEKVGNKSLRSPNEDTTEREVTPATDETADSDGDIYQVEKLLRQRIKDGEHQLLIKWIGFPSQNSWEPASSILNKSLVKQFYDQHPRAARYDNPDLLPRVTALWQKTRLQTTL